MKKVFIDTSVLIAACKSKIGASSYVLMLCKKGLIQGYISRYVIYESKKQQFLSQIEKKRLNYFLLQCNLHIAPEADESVVHRYSRYIESKDAPILAAATNASIEYLVTFNTKDFMTKKLKELHDTPVILTPKKFIAVVK